MATPTAPRIAVSSCKGRPGCVKPVAVVTCRSNQGRSAARSQGPSSRGSPFVPPPDREAAVARPRLRVSRPGLDRLYGPNQTTPGGVPGAILVFRYWSGRSDSNARPPEPHSVTRPEWGGMRVPQWLPTAPTLPGGPSRLGSELGSGRRSTTARIRAQSGHGQSPASAAPLEAAMSSASAQTRARRPSKRGLASLGKGRSRGPLSASIRTWTRRRGACRRLPNSWVRACE